MQTVTVLCTLVSFYSVNSGNESDERDFVESVKINSKPKKQRNRRYLKKDLSCVNLYAYTFTPI